MSDIAVWQGRCNSAVWPVFPTCDAYRVWPMCIQEQQVPWHGDDWVLLERGATALRGALCGVPMQNPQPQADAEQEHVIAAALCAAAADAIHSAVPWMEGNEQEGKGWLYRPHLMFCTDCCPLQKQHGWCPSLYLLLMGTILGT
jgi:hypothetical protein